MINLEKIISPVQEPLTGKLLKSHLNDSKKITKVKMHIYLRGQIELSPLLEVKVDIADNTECTFFALQLYLMCILSLMTRPQLYA